MNTVVKGSKIRSLMVVLALSGSVFLAACNGGGSVNSTQSSTPVVKEQKGNAIDKLNSSVQEPSESAGKEQQEKQDGTEGKKGKSGTDNQGGAEGKSDQKGSGN